LKFKIYACVYSITKKGDVKSKEDVNDLLIKKTYDLS